MMNKRNVFSTLILIIFVSITLTVFQSCSKGEKQQKIDTSVNIALNLPLTGPFGIYGQTVRDGILLATDDLKQQQYPLKLNFDFKDNAGTAKQTVSVMQKQLSGKVDIYVSGVKPQTMAIFDQVVAKGLPYFVWVFDAFICDNHKNVFRTWVNFKKEPEKFIQYVKYKNPKKIAILYPNFPHVDEEYSKILLPRLENELGIKQENILVEVFQWDVKDFKDIFLKVKSFEPDLIILSGFQENFIKMVKVLNAYKMMKDGNVICGYDMVDAAPLLAKEEIEGIRLVTPVFNTRGDLQKIIDWKAKFKKKFNREPLYTDAYAYDMAMIIAEAAKKIQPPYTPEKWLKALNSVDIEGNTGKLKFDTFGDLEIQLDIAVYKDGKLGIEEIK